MCIYLLSSLYDEMLRFIFAHRAAVFAVGRLRLLLYIGWMEWRKHSAPAKYHIYCYGNERHECGMLTMTFSDGVVCRNPCHTVE